MDSGIAIPFAALVFGLILGSFLNVCIHRIPSGKSIVYPSSSCPFCGDRIRFYDNIPVLSYVALRGRCRSCGARIPLRYPVVELLTGILSMALVMRFGPGVPFALHLAFVSALIVVTFIDFKHQIIPDVISLPGIIAGLVVSFTPWGTVSWADAVIGAAAGGGGLLAVAWTFERLTGKEGMGLGDVKLLAMIGAWMGWLALPFIILSSSLFGLVIGGGALLATRRGLRARIPFGPFLALGALLVFFFEREILYFCYGLLR
jgi:leader peptidase (prepilin peptidase) / N-methyltransferase